MAADDPIDFPKLNFSDFVIEEPAQVDSEVFCEPPPGTVREGEEVHIFRNVDAGMESVWAKSKYGWRRVSTTFPGKLEKS